MALSAIAKRQALADRAVASAAAVLQHVNILAECAAEQAAMGGDGNFADADPPGGDGNPYLSAYNVGLLISTVGPNLAAALQAHVNADGTGPKNVDVIRLCVPSPPV